MAEERAMGDDDEREVESAVDGDSIDLDTDAAGELDAAMREALEAIEAGQRVARTDDGAATLPFETASPDDPISALTKEVQEQRERALRALADLENYRKRVQRERREESRFKAFDPMREFVSVVDNLERALAAPGSVEELKLGVEMILRQMANLLREHGVERIEAVGKDFDPSLHEAVTRDEDPGVDVPTVSEELQRGYKMHDRLLRPAVVKVAMPPIEGKAAAKDGS